MARRSIRTAAVWSLASGLVIQSALLVASIAIARQLGVEGRGHFALITAVPIVIAYTGSGGLINAVVFHVSRRPTAVRVLFAGLWPSVAVQAIVLSLLHLVTIRLLHADDGLDVVAAAMVTVPVIPAWLICQYGTAALQGSQLFTAQSIARALPYALYAVGTLAFAFIGGRQLATFTAVWTAGYLVAGLAIFVYSMIALPSTDGVSPPDRPRSLWKFGLRDAIGAASPIDTFKADQLFVGIFLSPAALGIYAAAGALANVARLIGQSMGAIAYPIAARDSDMAVRPTRDPRLRALLAAAMSLSLMAALAGVLLVDLIVPAVYGRAFMAAVPVAQVLLAGSVFLSLRRVLSDIARGTSRPGAVSISEIVGWMVLGLGLLSIVPQLGLIGVAVSVVLYWVAACLILATTLKSGTGRRGFKDETHGGELVEQ